MAFTRKKTGSFSEQIELFSEKAIKNAEEIIVNTRGEMSDRIINGTPVYTGYARGNWQADTEGYPKVEIQRFDDEMGYAPASGEGVSLWEAKNVASTNIDKDFYLVNNVDYIRDLEYAHKSNQAPNGMVRLAVIDFKNIIDDVVKDLK